MTASTIDRQAWRFFLHNAGYCVPPGRAACAKALAQAERWAEEAGFVVEWELDHVTNREFTDEGPEYFLWQATAYLPCETCGQRRVVASLGGVDFGAGRDPWMDDYRRVVEAELALEVMNERSV